MNVLSIKQKNLEDHLEKDLNLLKEYEDKLRYEDDPKKIGIYSGEIENLKKQIESREVELNTITHRLQRSEKADLPKDRKEFEPTVNTVSFGSKPSPASQIGKQTLSSPDHSKRFAPPFKVKDFVGRGKILEEISKISTETRIISITGISGIGKSSLLKQLTVDLNINRIFWYEFVSGFVSLDDLLVKLAQFVSYNLQEKFESTDLLNNGFSNRDRIEKLIEELNKADFYLFFDNFDAAANDDETNDFLRFLKKELSKGIVYIGSQKKPTFYQLADEEKEVVHHICIEGLTLDETEIYFQSKGFKLKLETLEKIEDALGGMPLALNLLINAVDKNCCDEEFLVRAEVVKERVVEELFEAVYKKLSKEEKELLTTAALFSLPFSKQNLLTAHRQIFQKNASGNFISLVRRNLILNLHLDYFTVHKTIDYLALSLAETNLNDARETIAEHFLEDLPDDYYANLESLMLFIKAENYDRAANVTSDLIDRRFLMFDLKLAEMILKKFEDKPISDENRMWYLGDRGLVAQHLHRYEKSAQYYEEMLALAKEIDNNRGEALALHRLGSLNWETKDLQRAEEFYRQSLKLRIETEDYEGQSQIHNNLGLLYSDQGNFKAALAEYEIGLELRQKAKLPEWSYLSLYSNLGILYAREENWDKAFEYSNKALKVSEDFESPYDIAKSIYNLGKHESTLGNEEKAREKFFQVLETAEKYGIAELEELSCTALGRSYGDEGEYVKAISYFERVADIYEQTEDNYSLAQIIFDMGTYHFLNDNKQSSLEYYLKGINLLEFSEISLAKSNLNNICNLAGDFGISSETRQIIKRLKEKRRELAQSANPTIIQAHVCDALSAIYQDILHNERGAIAYLRGRVNVTEKLNLERELAKAWLDLGLVNEEFENFNTALDANNSALQIIEQKNLKDLLGIALYNTANIYTKITEFETAEEFYRRSEAAAISSNDTVLLSKIHHNLGETYSRSGRPQKALELLKIALDKSQEQNEPLEVVFSLNSLGLAYEDLNQETDALTCWHEAVDLSRQQDLGREEGNLQISIGNFYLKIGNFESAKHYYEQSLEVATKLKNIDMEEAAMLSLALAHKRLGSFSEIEKEFIRIAERSSELKHQENLVKFLAIAGAVNLSEGEIDEAVKMFEKAFLLAYWRILEFAVPFIESGKKIPANLLELPFLLAQLETSLYLAIENNQENEAQTFYQNLIDSLNKHKIWREDNFIIDLLKEVCDKVFEESEIKD